jgi:hypothetical protein
MGAGYTVGLLGQNPVKLVFSFGQSFASFL